MKHPKHIAGNIRWNASDDYSDVETVGGWLYCRGAGTRAAFPALTAVGGYLDCVGADTKAAFPALTAVGGCLYCYGADTRTAFPALTTVGGWLDCHGADIRAAFPALTAVGGWLYCGGADTRTAFPALTAVGGGLGCDGADTRAAFPKLEARNIKSRKSRIRVASAFRRAGFLWADDILAAVISERVAPGGITVFRVRIPGQIETSAALRLPDGTCAHGKNLKEARASLLFKIGDRDKSAYAGWTPDTVVTKRQAIESYRVITGACESGTRHFVATVVGKTKPRYKVSEIIALTRGQYGSRDYAAFFDRKP